MNSALTTDPFTVYTSNIFAILGLRALYFALAAVIDRFRYLKPALAIVLIFIGSKIFVADLLGLEKFPAAISLGVTFGIICQRAPKFRRMWASKIPYLAGFWFRGSADVVIGLDPPWRTAAEFGRRRRRDEGFRANMLGNEIGMLAQAVA